MNPEEEIAEAIESAAANIEKAAALIRRNRPEEARKSLLISRIDLEFALGVIHLLTEKDESESREKAQPKTMRTESDPSFARVSEWLRKTRNCVSKGDFQGAKVPLLAIIGFIESTMKSIERGRRGVVREPL